MPDDTRREPPNSPPTATPASPWRLVSLLAALAWIGPFAVDTYMPSFRAIGVSLGASALQVQQTLSAYLAAFAVMLLFYGALSDALGRRRVILGSLAAFVIGSLGCALAFDIQTLWFFRAVQGAAAGAGMVVGRAIIRDLFHAEEAQRMMSRLTLIFGLAPAVAPIIGGWLQVLFGWHSIFVFLALLGVALFWLTYTRLPESLPAAQRLPFHPLVLLKSYRAVITSRSFLLLACAVGLNFSAFFLYVAAAPAFLMDILGLGEHEFAWLFLPGIAGIMLGASVSGRLAGKLSPQRSVRLGYAVMIAAVIMNIVLNLLLTPRVPWAVLPIFVYTIGMQIAMPSITLLIIDLFPRTKGLAASLQAFLSSTLNAVVAGSIAPALSGSALALCLGMAVILGIGYLSWFIFQGTAHDRAT